MSINNYIVDYAVVGSNGVIVRMGQCTIESLHLQAGPGELVMQPDVGVDDETHFWDGAVFRPYPPKPGPWAVWGGGAWLDPRDPDTEAQKAAEALQAARQAASLTKLQFMIAAVTAGLISQESGLRLLDGQLPPELAGLTDAMGDNEKFLLSAKLKGAAQIDRLDPFIALAGEYLGMTETQIDALFGVTIAGVE